MLLEALGTARDLGRLQDIIGVLARHGLGNLVRKLGLAQLFGKAGKALHLAPGKGFVAKRPEVHLREALEELGPSFVKLGQVLAGRSDLLPPHYVQELSRLREDARPVPPAEARAALLAELGAPPEELFADFDDEPLAAASIAQVHRARLEDGREVVLKLRRPGIEETVDADLRLLTRLAEILEREVAELRRYRPRSLCRQFAQGLRNELDFRIEARNTERIAADLQEDSRVVVPRVHERFTTERLLVLDFQEGPSLGDWVASEFFDPEEARELAGIGAEAVLHMVLVEGFYHADPHAGNVIRRPDGSLALLDFGMVGRLSEARRFELMSLFGAIVERREDDVVGLLLDWSEAKEADVDGLVSDCGAFIDRYHGLPLGQLDVSELLRDIADILRHNDLFLPPDVAMLLKVLVTLEDLGRQLDPDFDMAERARPFVQRELRRALSPGLALARGTRELGLVLAGLPRDLRRILARARRGNFRLQIGLRGLEDFSRQFDRSVNRLTIGLVTSALIIGTSIALSVSGGPTLFGLPLFALLGFGSSIVAGFWLLWLVLRSPR